MAFRPRKPRYAVGGKVGRFVVRKTLGRRPPGPTSQCFVWWYRLACRFCGAEREASQPVMLNAERGRSLACQPCRAVALKRKAAGLRAPEPVLVDVLKPMPEENPAPQRAVRPSCAPGSAVALWCAAMGVS